MFSVEAWRKEWKGLTFYQRFEHTILRIIMLFIAVVIVYSLALTAIELAKDFTLGLSFMDSELLQDVFGSLLTVIILLEFNHSIASWINTRSNILQVKVVVLIAILVVARKIILLDFKAETLEHLAGIAGMALALGVLYWLLNANSAESQRSSATSQKVD